MIVENYSAPTLARTHLPTDLYNLDTGDPHRAGQAAVDISAPID